MIRSALLVAAVALSWAGCATTEKALGGDGASCQVPADCEKGFTCKASRCTPHESRVGEVCVTDKGCEASLSCLEGRCSAGRATAEDNARACQHIRRLMEAATRFQEAQTGERTPEAELQLQLAAFTAECLEKFGARTTGIEKIWCIEGGKTLEAVRSCP